MASDPGASPPEGEEPAAAAGPAGNEGAPAPGETPEDALRRLEDRLNRASDAAERLLTDAAESAASRLREKPPPAGWATPGPSEDAAARGSRDGDLELLIGLLRSMRDLIPPDLQRRLAEAVREVLLALRALIDWYLERVQRGRGEATEVEDIPIS